jgi:ubiquinone/menaquinone biosynthesis C-methylase UbiE
MKKVISPYLNLKRLKKPKDDFYTCIKIIKTEIKNKNNSILDVGCANGEFLNFLINRLKDNYYFGLDANKKFLDVAKKNLNLKEVKFIKNDLFKFRNKNKYDLVICMGVSHLLKDIKKLLQKLISFTKINGYVIVDGFFNKYDIDTITYYKDYSLNQKRKWNCDFNQFSKKQLINYLKNKNIKKYKFFEAKLKSKIKKKHDLKPHHFVWTEKKGNSNLVTNGTNINLKRSFLLIKI